MQVYTTSPLTGKQCDDFIEWFDSVIGTETEIEKSNNNAFTVTCFELESNEVSKCRYFESNKLSKI